MAEAFVQFGIPGVEGGAVRIPFVDDAEAMRAEIVRGLKLASYTREKFLGAFPEAEPPAAGSEHANREEPPHRGNQAAVAFCPEHNNAPCRFSAPKYNKDGDRMYHPLPREQWTKDDRGGDVKNHSLYWRQTVDANGESNEGKLIPQGKA